MKSKAKGKYLLLQQSLRDSKDVFCLVIWVPYFHGGGPSLPQLLTLSFHVEKEPIGEVFLKPRKIDEETAREAKEDPGDDLEK